MIRRPARPFRRARVAVAAAALGVAALGACSSDGESPLSSASLPDGGSIPAAGSEPASEPAPEPDSEPASEPAPEPESVPASEPAAPTDGSDPSSDGETTTGELVLLILIGIAVVAIVIVIVGAATSRSRKKDQQRSRLRQDLDNVTGGCRWVIDEGSMSVLQASSGSQAQGTWNSVRGQIYELEGRIVQLSGGTGDSGLDDSLSALGQSVAELRGSLESYVATMSSDQTDLVDAARQTVLQRRLQVETALQPVFAAHL